MAWTDEQKEQVYKMYKAADPTPETSTEIVKEIADELEQSPNGVRMLLIQAGLYVKKDSATSSKGASKASGDGTKRVSKETQIEALRKAIEEAGAEVDEDIISKLTGKAAAYFVAVLTK